MILVESFRDRVYDKMNIEKNKLKVNKRKKEEHIFLFYFS